MTREHQADTLEEEVLDFTARYWHMDRDELSTSTRLSEDLGMDGDDAFEFFRAFGEEFKVNLDGLHANWKQHFSPEVGAASFGVIAAICVCVTAGFWLGDVLGILPSWGWAIALMGIAFAVYQRWFARKGMLSITVGDLVDSARSGRWTGRTLLRPN